MADIASSGTWFTDSNGRDMQKRVLNFRPTWKLNVTDPCVPLALILWIAGLLSLALGFVFVSVYAVSGCISPMMCSVSGNFYPVDSSITIGDATRKLSVTTDRSQGGASLQDGEIELMVRFSRTCHL